MATAFQNISYENLFEGRVVNCDVLVCSNNKAARKTVIELVKAAGLSGFDAGPLANSVVVEGLTSILIGLNVQFGVQSSGIRITGIPRTTPCLTITGLTKIPLIQPGDDLSGILLDALDHEGITLSDGDILVLAQKIVSKAEGRLVSLSQVTPSREACDLAVKVEKDPVSSSWCSAKAARSCAPGRAR